MPIIRPPKRRIIFFVVVWALAALVLWHSLADKVWLAASALLAYAVVSAGAFYGGLWAGWRVLRQHPEGFMEQPPTPSFKLTVVLGLVSVVAQWVGREYASSLYVTFVVFLTAPLLGLLIGLMFEQRVWKPHRHAAGTSGKPSTDRTNATSR